MERTSLHQVKSPQLIIEPFLSIKNQLLITRIDSILRVPTTEIYLNMTNPKWKQAPKYQGLTIATYLNTRIQIWKQVHRFHLVQTIGATIKAMEIWRKQMHRDSRANKLKKVQQASLLHSLSREIEKRTKRKSLAKISLKAMRCYQVLRENIKATQPNRLKT